uniref:Formate/nitrite transporter n=1 Tax=Chromera velia CCMP2878 TaxID=1169474 RepID=A0A0G4FPR1_9ALVE|eukprot:Cvel_3582.t1-p1 / transcript=Cvel_3582.t1 / gene=Cvel_3582 / organism=Chromera_velia_CCMP2878 / gene_product=Probable formate transporter, putative / transcript_product=Probable formate transporter, putative / location=Cvel_scaffold146:91213-92764(+) / protein_length=406 / sequence_SO=supercontig / SO=protein_coding / is_pseudo=false
MERQSSPTQDVESPSSDPQQKPVIEDPPGHVRKGNSSAHRGRVVQVEVEEDVLAGLGFAGGDSVPVLRLDPGNSSMGLGLRQASQSRLVNSDVHSLLNHRPLPPVPPARFEPPTNVRMGVESIDGAFKMVQSSIDSGFGKVHYEFWQNAINGIVAGAFIAFGGWLMNVVMGGSPELKKTNPGLLKLVGGLVFPFGLVAVVLTGAELITSTFSTVGAAVLSGQLNGKFMRTGMNLLIVYWCNFLGAILVAGLAVGSGALDSDPYKSFCTGLAEKKVDQSFLSAFTKGIVCNWLVSLAVFLAFAPQDVTGKVLAIWPPIAAFVALGMDHCVANMFFLPLGLFLGANFTVADMFAYNLVPVTLGNFVGSQMIAMVFAARFKRFWFLRVDTPPPPGGISLEQEKKLELPR